MGVIVLQKWAAFLGPIVGRVSLLLSSNIGVQERAFIYYLLTESPCLPFNHFEGRSPLDRILGSRKDPCNLNTELLFFQVPIYAFNLYTQ